MMNEKLKQFLDSEMMQDLGMVLSGRFVARTCAASHRQDDVTLLMLRDQAASTSSRLQAAVLAR